MTSHAIPTEGKFTYRDPETRDYQMYLDAQFIGCARTQTEADVTLDTLVDEIARHTRAESADMAAETAAETIGTCERCHKAPATHQVGGRSAAALWLCDACGELAAAPARTLDEELAAQGLRLADEDEAGWYHLITGGKHVWATDEPPRFDSPVSAPIFEEETAPYLATPTWTDDKITVGLASDASDDDRSLALALSNLRARAQNDCPCGSSCPCCDPSHEEAPERAWEEEEAESSVDLCDCGNRAVHVSELSSWCDECAAMVMGDAKATTPIRTVAEPQDELDAVTDTILAAKRAGFECGTLQAQRRQTIAELDEAHKRRVGVCHCGSLAVAPDASLCPYHATIEAAVRAYRESGEAVPYTGLGACEGYDWVPCPNDAVQEITINIALNDHAILPDLTRVCASCAAKWQPRVIPANTCRACGKGHSTQRCPEVRAALLGD